MVQTSPEARLARAGTARKEGADPLAGSTERGLPVKRVTGVARRLLTILLVLVILYAAVGLVFHIKWQSAQETCRAIRRAQGEFVEPEVFGGALGLLFDVTYWPIYAWANMYHDGTPFATPCTKGPRDRL